MDNSGNGRKMHLGIWDFTWNINKVVSNKDVLKSPEEFMVIESQSD